MRRLLPEWAAQSAVLLAWPDEATDWAPLLADVRSEYCELIAVIARYEKAVVLVRDTGGADQLRESLDADTRRQVLPVLCEYHDTWTRDYGPLTVADADTLCFVNFAFDGWGGKFGAVRDDRITRQLHANGLFGDIELSRHERVLEGGALDTDGDAVALCNRDFKDPADGRACEMIKGAFPDRDVVGIPSSNLLRQFGGVHCVTMQLPAGVPVNAIPRH